jgi:hypothetical protein
MPDPSVSDALAEAYALAPSHDLVLHTLEVRHPLFVDGQGSPDSMWLVANDEDIRARIEASAAVRAGEMVTFKALPFRFSLAPIEAGSTPEIEVTIDGVSRTLVPNLDRAVTDTNKIVMVYRPYLYSDLLGGPQMDPPPSFELSEVQVTALAVIAKARTSVDLRGAFPRL